MNHKTWKFAGLMAALATLLVPSLGWAAAGHPVDWQMGLQDAATPVEEYIHWFHNILVIVITVIVVFVMGLLLYVMVKFNAKANPVPSKTTHNTLIEVLWTVIPVLILVSISIPSLRLLYLERDIPKGDMTVKIIGNPSWNWTYEYPDLGVNEDKSAKVSFTSYLLPEDKAKEQNRTYLLATDVPMVVPVNKIVKIIVTADPEGIIHSWTIPSFGVKIDAIPGRLNEDWFQVTKEGVYNGQCSELCGKEHAFMPIEVWAVSEDKFMAWADLQLKGPKPDELDQFLKTIRPESAQVATSN
ncbi:MAG: cytochrome c oxidase subunit II [Aestuariivirga sp.]